MKSTGRIKGIIAATAAVALLVTASASAEERHRDGTRHDNDHYRDNGSHRDENRGYRNENHSDRNENHGYRNETRNNHFSDRGRVRSFTRERDGYRVFIEGARYPYWIPFSRLGRHRLSVGLDIRLGGIFNGAYVDADVLGWPGDPYYNDGYSDGGNYNGYADGYLSGRVERVDFRYGRLLLRDDRSGRTVEVDMRSTAGRRGLDLSDVRPGDRVTLQGSWDRGYFHAFRIDGVQQY